MLFVSFFRRNIVLRFTLTVVLMMLVMVFVAQGIMSLVYQENFRAQLLASETVALQLASDNISSQIRPYLLYLYSAATDRDVLEHAQPDAAIGAPRAYNVIWLREWFMGKILPASMIDNMAVLYEDGSYVRYEKVESLRDQSVLWQTSYRDERVELYARTRASKLPVVSFEPASGRRVYVSVPLIGERLAREETFAVVALSLDMSFLKSTFAQIDRAGVRHFLTDRDGNILMCQDEALLRQHIDTVESDGAVMRDMEISKQRWKLYMQIDQSDMMADMNSALNVVNLVYVVLIAILVVVIVVMFSHMLLPVRRLISAMGDAGGGKSLRVRVQGEHELWRLAGHFNDMMDRMDSANAATKTYYQQTLQAERRQRQAEMETLEAHINAHFLFNTLNAINMQALASGNREVSVSIKRLANIMRYAFNSRLTNVFLFQEASWVEQYLFMQKERMGDLMTYDVSVDDDVADWPFRKMMLQPFVENAIIHGMKDRTETVLLLSARAGGGNETVLITISDNGNGMGEETLARVRRILAKPKDGYGHGIGLGNVAERIYAFFGPDARIEVASEPGRGTVFTLELPWPKGVERAEAGEIEEDKDDEIY